jgi:hypothetical protein
MTLQKDHSKPPQNRTQKIVMYSVFGVAAVLAIIAIVIFLVSGQKLF